MFWDRLLMSVFRCGLGVALLHLCPKTTGGFVKMQVCLGMSGVKPQTVHLYQTPGNARAADCFEQRWFARGSLCSRSGIIWMVHGSRLLWSVLVPIQALYCSDEVEQRSSLGSERQVQTLSSATS